VRLPAPLLLASLVAAGSAAHAQLYDGAPYPGGVDVPLDPPLALPQQINGVLRGSSAVRAVEQIVEIRDVFRAVRACWRSPAFPNGPTGMQITVRLSFKKDGQIIGRPAITYFQGTPERRNEERFVASVLSAFHACAPLPFTAEFGSAIAGRPFTFRFIDDRRT
jgi:hypothetical protein